MGRYDLPDPICSHVPCGIVRAGDMLTGPHASTHVCHRHACVADARAWVRAQTRLEPTYVPKPEWAERRRRRAAG
jgi:hypothetical protein